MLEEVGIKSHWVISVWADIDFKKLFQSPLRCLFQVKYGEAAAAVANFNTAQPTKVFFCVHPLRNVVLRMLFASLFLRLLRYVFVSPAIPIMLIRESVSDMPCKKLFYARLLHFLFCTFSDFLSI